MNIGKREIIIGVLFAVVVTIFIDYSTIEHIIARERVAEFRVSPLAFSMMWNFVLSLIFYLFYVSVLRLFRNTKNNLLEISTMVVGGVIIMILMNRLYPLVRELFESEPIRNRHITRMLFRAMTRANLLKPMVVMVLNLFFVYILKLLYTNQDIARRNEQLQLETIKTQHNALVQQINPHFFFNSLNSLRYIILKKENDSAIDYLDNLTAIFRRTLKASNNALHLLVEEMSISTSYSHIIERRFEGKLSIRFDIQECYEGYMMAPMSILTLLENVVKHNKISEKVPVVVRVYTSDDNTITVENNIVPKFEEGEKSGIGLKNLQQQYELLTQRKITISSTADTFQVTLPLIPPRV